jgi:hypothetical protein
MVPLEVVSAPGEYGHKGNPRRVPIFITVVVPVVITAFLNYIVVPITGAAHH